MCAAGLRAKAVRGYRAKAGIRARFSQHPNRLWETRVTRPNQVWVGDITYLKVGALWRYLAVVMDKCSRRIVGWSFGRNKDVQLTLRALNRAVYNRRMRTKAKKAGR